MLQNAAAFFGLKSADLVQIVISGLIAITGMWAALAARRAAQATQATVTEMREARLQTVRPHLVGRLDETSKVTLVWERGKAPQIDRGERLFLEDPNPAHFIITNLGMGAAIDIKTAWWRAGKKAFSNTEIELLRTFFALGGMELTVENETLVLHDPKRGGYWQYFPTRDMPAYRAPIPYLAAGEEIKTPICDDSVFCIMLEALLVKLTTAKYGEKDARNRRDTVTLSYTSSSGEQFQRKITLMLICSYVSAYCEKRNAEPGGPWDSFRASIHLAWQEV